MGEDSDPCVYYRDACLAMLGGSESISDSPALESSGLLVKTVEDYLYTSLWQALHVTEIDGVGVTAGYGGGEGGGLRKLADVVARLSVLVNQWGPSYFEQDEDVNGGGASYTGASEAVALAARGGGSVTKSANAVPRSGGWAYALPLLASQQYATALAYLAEAGGGLGLLQAAHVGIVMDAEGLSVTDFSLDAQSGISSRSLQQALLPMLVVSYSASLQGSDAGAALRYLALMSGKGKFVKEQVRMSFTEEVFSCNKIMSSHFFSFVDRFPRIPRFNGFYWKHDNLKSSLVRWKPTVLDPTELLIHSLPKTRSPPFLWIAPTTPFASANPPMRQNCWCSLDGLVLYSRC